MKLGKLINKLEKLRMKYGDVEVVCGNSRYPVYDNEQYFELDSRFVHIVTEKTNPRVRIR